MVPDARVQGHLHGGPHDGETVLLPWARIEVPMVHWEGDEMIVSKYRLAGLWLYQVDVPYSYVEPEPVAPTRPGVVVLACLWLSRRLAGFAEARS